MKIVSLTICHYGRDYLPYALESVLPIVDRAGVFYTANPSHGTQLNIHPIETRQDIIDCLPTSDKIDFVNASGFKYEGQHRDFSKEYLYHTYHPDYIIVLDTDEVWPIDTLHNVFNWLPEQPKNHHWLLNFTHFWKSFNWVCRDNMWPIRIFDCHAETGTGYLDKNLGEIYHFGYATTNKVMSYKWKCHGHVGEIRLNWKYEKWLNWKPGVNDVHPTCENTWDPEPFDKTVLPDFMKSHPFYNKERIE